MGYLLLFFAFFLTGCSTEPTEEKSVFTPPPLFSQANPTNSAGSKTTMPASGTGSQVIVLNEDIAKLHEGQQFSFEEPGRGPRQIEIGRRSVAQNGDITLAGTLLAESGEFRMIATIGASGTFGRIQTPKTTYQITVKDGKTLLVDLYGPGNALVPKEKDDMAMPPAHPPTPQSQKDDAQTGEAPILSGDSPTLAGRTTVDVLIIYTPGMAADNPGDLLQTRLNYLVATANAAYVNSGVNIYLRRVHAELVNYSDQTSNDTALDLLTNGQAPFEGVKALRQLHGADLVVLVRKYSYAYQNGCGLAWILGNNGSFAGQSGYGYSVVSDGSEMVGGMTYYCTDLTFTHELGHNMGSAHDRANASSYPPVYPYSYGYGISGRFGTVMSYLNPEVDVFSNPALTCGPQNDPCGVNENDPASAHNTLSLNNAAGSIAAFVQSQYSGDVDEDGQVTLKDGIKSLMILSGQTPTGTINKLEDIDSDGKIGMAEVIYSLQQQH